MWFVGKIDFFFVPDLQAFSANSMSFILGVAFCNYFNLMSAKRRGLFCRYFMSESGNFIIGGRSTEFTSPMFVANVEMSDGK